MFTVQLLDVYALFLLPSLNSLVQKWPGDSKKLAPFHLLGTKNSLNFPKIQPQHELLDKSVMI